MIYVGRGKIVISQKICFPHIPLLEVKALSWEKEILV